MKKEFSLSFGGSDSRELHFLFLGGKEILRFYELFSSNRIFIFVRTFIILPSDSYKDTYIV